MGPQNRKKTSRIKTWLIFAALAIIAFFPTDMMAASKGDLVGTWNASALNDRGVFMTARFSFNEGGDGSFNVYANGNLVASAVFVWDLPDDDTVCMNSTEGRRDCMNIDFVSNTNLSLSSSTGRTVYARVGSQVPFGYSRTYACNSRGCFCKKYERISWVNSDCKNCHHSKGLHPDADK